MSPSQSFSRFLCAGVGIGSGVVRHDLLAKGDYAGITALAKQYTDIVKDMRA